MEGLFSSLAFISAAGGTFYALGIIAMQGLTWLEQGQWPSVPISAAFDYFKVAYPHVEWTGFQEMISVLLTFPLSLGVFSAGLAGAWIIIWITGVPWPEPSRPKHRYTRETY